MCGEIGDAVALLLLLLLCVQQVNARVRNIYYIYIFPLAFAVVRTLNPSISKNTILYSSQ